MSESLSLLFFRMWTWSAARARIGLLLIIVSFTLFEQVSFTSFELLMSKLALFCVTFTMFERLMLKLAVSLLICFSLTFFTVISVTIYLSAYTLVTHKAFPPESLDCIGTENGMEYCKTKGFQLHFAWFTWPLSQKVHEDLLRLLAFNHLAVVVCFTEKPLEVIFLLQSVGIHLWSLTESFM